MNAVMSPVPPEILEWRKRTGADRFDEMWEGVLHTPPLPSRLHQDLEYGLESFLRSHWARLIAGRAYHNIAISKTGGWPTNFRIPDLVLLKPDRFYIDRNTHFEGASTVVVEIRSPDDESEENFPFYQDLSVPEVWIIDRDTKQPDLYILRNGQYEKQIAVDCWYPSDATGIEMRFGLPGKLAIRMASDDSTREDLPQ